MEITKNPKQYVFGLDIGTRSIVGTVGYKNSNNRFQVVAQIAKEHETRAMLDGQIHDIAAVSKTISEVKKQLESQLNIELKDVCIAAAGRVLKTVTTMAEYSFETETVITKEYIHSLEMLGIEQAYDTLKNQENNDSFKYYCVGYTVVKYFINDYLMLSLEDHKGSKIGAEVLATFLPEEVIDGLYSCVENAGLTVANLTLEPIAAMEVAIPEQLRLLNLALVDVGAGTSDISITRDGSITAFGMIPFAGDEITEYIAKKYLVDFNTGEKIKQACLRRKSVSYKDIMGISHKLPISEVLNEVDEIIRLITKKIADKIIELNGGTSVSAVFVVGGGGKLPAFVDSLAEYLELSKERVALRGHEVLGMVDFIDTSIKKDSMIVTPIGICLNYYEKRNNFVFITVNGDIVKLYDNGHLSVLDAAAAVGISTLDLFPKRGASLTYQLNGEVKTVRGLPGEAAMIYVNKKEANMSTPLNSHDVIDITLSEAGEDAREQICKLEEVRRPIVFLVNGIEIPCPRKVEVNKNLVEYEYSIEQQDKVTVLNYYTLEWLLSYLDIDYSLNILVNGVEGQYDDKLYEHYSITIPENENHEIPKEEIGEEIQEEKKGEEEVSFWVEVNGTKVALTGKTEYVLVDILEVYPFDPSLATKKKLIITVNDNAADFTTKLSLGDRIQLLWGD